MTPVLFLIADGEHRHYTAIKSLTRLLRSSNSKHEYKQHFCINCLQGFSYEGSRDKHVEYCKDNEAVRIEMPKRGSFVKFHDGPNQFKVPFVMYADFEAILKPIKLLSLIQKNRILKLSISTFPLVSVHIESWLMEKLKIY